RADAKTGARSVSRRGALAAAVLAVVVDMARRMRSWELSIERRAKLGLFRETSRGILKKNRPAATAKVCFGAKPCGEAA
ncbi:MAG: hypothetical protein LBD14_04820, partial [Puniceicoccales bacterium]|nr:hypothetical protein [Puniceicoccales bacterium]